MTSTFYTSMLLPTFEYFGSYQEDAVCGRIAVATRDGGKPKAARGAKTCQQPIVNRGIALENAIPGGEYRLRL